MPRENWPSLDPSERLPGQGEKAMSIYEHPIAMLVRSAGAGSSRITRAKAAALQAIQPLSGTAGDALFAYAMTGSAMASFAIIAVLQLEMLLRCVFHGRGKGRGPPRSA
jgi:hypothetical protein